MKKVTIHTLETLFLRSNEVGDCIEWNGYFQNKVPFVNHNGNFMSVRRLIFDLIGRKYEPKTFVGVICENKKCINPEHLILRSMSDHISFMAHNVNHNHPVRITKLQKAAKNRRIFTDEQIADIRCNEKSSAQIARELNVSKSLISKIKRNKSNRVISATSNPFAAMFK